MTLAIILSTNKAETNWNAFRLANVASRKGDTVAIFLVGEGVEYGKNTSKQFDIKSQVDTFLQSDGKIIACGTCMALRHQKVSKECPGGGIQDLYNLVADYDKVITF